MKIYSHFKEERHRLPWDDYRGTIAVAFTLCIKDHAALFTNQEIFSTFENILIDESKREGCSAAVYVFMPDHCHILMIGDDVHSDCLRAIIGFKQRTGYWLSRNKPSVKWQKDFYDHILREDDDLTKQFLYIINNPSRAGLVEDWRKYPFKGSMVNNFSEFES
jgi:putative transposase